jgi:carbonic anhydrase
MSHLNFEGMMTNVNQGMDYLHNLTDIDQVVILGHSGGGTMMAAYQNIAEYGASACQRPEKIYPCSDAMESLDPGDRLILIDANCGISTMALLSLNYH